MKNLRKSQRNQQLPEAFQAAFNKAFKEASPGQWVGTQAEPEWEENKKAFVVDGVAYEPAVKDHMQFLVDELRATMSAVPK